MADTIPKKLYDALIQDSEALQSSSQKLNQALKKRKKDTWMGWAGCCSHSWAKNSFIPKI